MRLSNLAHVLRAAGLTVVEIDGWQSRGRAFAATPKAVICHHTAGPSAARNGKDYPSLGVVRDGRAGLPGPLCQIGIGRSGTIYVVASGRANHAGKVNNPKYGNASTIGIEAENSGNEPWPQAQYRAYLDCVRALCKTYNIAHDDVRGHKEICYPRGRKPDPSFSMSEFRASLAKFRPDTHVPNHPTDQEEETMKLGDKSTEVRQLQRTINGILARSERLGNPPIAQIAVDGIFGNGTAEALAHAHKRAQIALGLDWDKDWSTNEVTVMDRTLLLQGVIELGRQLKAKG